MRRGDRWRAGVVVGLVGLILSVRPCESVEPIARGGDPALPRLVHIAPGTPVDGALPEGWTARVVRSVPRLASGAIATLPDSAKTTATLFRTTILAEVARDR
ncbi:MAG TPA: hypothetical protein VGH33_12955, partial [Isosphaeraceae bacterium]